MVEGNQVEVGNQVEEEILEVGNQVEEVGSLEVEEREVMEEAIIITSLEAPTTTKPCPSPAQTLIPAMPLRLIVIPTTRTSTALEGSATT